MRAAMRATGDCGTTNSPSYRALYATAGPLPDVWPQQYLSASDWKLLLFGTCCKLPAVVTTQCVETPFFSFLVTKVKAATSSKHYAR
jgi:hypothetical protein